MSDAKRIAKNIILIVGGGTFRAVLMPLFTIFIARQLGTEGFGAFSFALSLAVAAGSLPAAVALSLFAGTAAALTPALKVAFVEGMRSALHLSFAICLVAAGLSFVRGPERRQSRGS